MSDDAPSLFDVALYLVCSSRMALDETLPYASMRLLDGAGRLLQAAPDDRSSPRCSPSCRTRRSR